MHDFAQIEISTPENIGNVSQKLARQIIARMDAQGLKPKSKKRDTIALELACGAALALQVSECYASRAWDFACMMISVRGASYLDELAKPEQI